MNNYLKILFQKISLRRMIFFLIADILLISLAIYLAFLLRFDGKIPQSYNPVIQKVIILALLFLLPIFYFSKLYSFSWSYVSANELISLMRATTFGFLFLGVAIYISKDFPFFHGFPRSTLFISYFLTFLFSGAIRFSKRVYLQALRSNKAIEKERTLIAGAGDAGEHLLRSILNSPDSPYLPVGFLDDDISKKGSRIHGIPVLGLISNTPDFVKSHLAQGLIIALPSASSRVIKRAVEAGREAGLKKIRIIPPITEIINGEVSIGDIRDIQIEDLLGREPVLLDTKSIEDFINQKTILITGAAGSIGAELARQVAKFNPSLFLLLDQDETGIFNISRELNNKFPKLNIVALVANIRDKQKIERIFNQYQPQIVFHAAAYKHVPLMEFFPDEAVKTNIFGTEIMALVSLKYGVENFVFISTDKAVNPTSVMGVTKRVGEMICQNLNQKNATKFISVRFGNVLDSRGNVVSIFKEQIKNRGTIEVTHQEMKRYFMSTSEACLLVMQASQMGQGGEVFVLNMGEPIKIFDLAKEMIRLSGFESDKDIPIVFTQPRPGEKLFEEILTAEEGTIETAHEKIFVAKLSDIDEEKLNLGLEKLKDTIKNPHQREEIINILKEIVPVYSLQPNSLDF